ncbi:transmembrane protein 114 [Elgaria multicarinata webbii]|uniref:transmembrane protein 114 n=1 Tax=Elgaria multicarinata webbii TaxID=159646 RepID=UPI002FCD6835
MKVTLKAVSLFAALFSILSFSFLAVAIGTDFWYLTDASKLEKLTNHTDSLSSHSGLWRTCRFKSTCLPLINPFKSERQNISTLHQHLLNMHGTFMILLPLSLIVMIFGGMTGFISILARTYFLLLFTGLLFLFGALITLAGVSIYIAYSPTAFKEAMRLLEKEIVVDVEDLNFHFGWSLGFAWFSLAAEVLAGLAFLLTARMVGQKQRQDNSI